MASKMTCLENYASKVASKIAQETPKALQDGFRTTPRRPKTAQTAPKTAPRRSQDSPGRPQNAPKTPPRRPQDDTTSPKALQDVPKTRKDASKTPQDTSRARFGNDFCEMLVRFWMVLQSILEGFGIHF